MRKTAPRHLQWPESPKSGLTTLVSKIKVVSAGKPPSGVCGLRGFSTLKKCTSVESVGNEGNGTTAPSVLEIAEKRAHNTGE
jgi:hypothetical protein